jgi:hypothetical protein
MKDAIILRTLHRRGNLLRRRMGWIGIAVALTLVHASTPVSTAAQESGGSTAAAVAGGALGLVSGSTLGAVGSIIPCSQTGPGPTCVRWSAIGGGTIGVTGGALLGAVDSDRLGDVAVGAGIGFVVGAIGGLLLKSKAERFGWQDVAAVGLFGGAIGSAPRGSAIGLLGGSALGLVTWALFDDFKGPDVLGAAVAGLAIGGIAEWLVRGIDAQSRGDSELQLYVPLKVGF